MRDDKKIRRYALSAEPDFPEDIIITDITKSYPGSKPLNHLSLTFPGGELTVLSGASGGGKTTLLRIIAGLDKPDSGTVVGAGKVAFMFQEDRLFPNMTAIENVMCAWDGKESMVEASDILNALGLGDSLNKKPDELSGGMKRRVSIARLLHFTAHYPCQTVLLDEPFKGLDADSARDTAALTFSCLKGKTVITVSHGEQEGVLPEGNRVKLN